MPTAVLRLAVFSVVTNQHVDCFRDGKQKGEENYEKIYVIDICACYDAFVGCGRNDWNVSVF